MTYTLHEIKENIFKKTKKEKKNPKLRPCMNYISSVHFSCSVVSDFLWHRGLQHTRLPCSSPASGACSISCPLSQWCHPAISSSVISFCSCPQSLPASESFPMSQLFTWGGQSIGHFIHFTNFTYYTWECICVNKWIKMM